MNQEYFNLNELIGMIDAPNLNICQKFLDENEDLIKIARGSSYNHQAWEGGYLDHLTETMNIAVLLYGSMNNQRELEFSLSDSLLVLFLHDIEKPWRFIKTESGWIYNSNLMNKEKQVWPFVCEKINEYGFVLTENHWNGIKYVEGEKRDHMQERRVNRPLAAFAHLCDTISARIWYDYPEDGLNW